MAKIIWDETGKRLYETGADRGVLYPLQSSGLYTKGTAWNGLQKVSEKPSGAEASPQYADNIKYLNLISAEEFKATIEAFTYPDEFAECDGSAEIQPGVSVGQQSRKTFGLSYRTTLGNDTEGTDYGYKLHLIYGALAAPSEKEYSTMNDKPEAMSLSWEITTTPVAVANFKPTASLVIDSTKVDSAKLAALELILYGNVGVEPRLPLPDEVAAIFAEVPPTAITVGSVPTIGATGVLVTDNVVLTFNNKVIGETIIMTSSAGSIIPVTKSWDTTGKILTINPVSDLAAATKYFVNVIGVADAYNQTLAPEVITFTTA
jgi:hypothetical protein